jgi:hypothetical protein
MNRFLASMGLLLSMFSARIQCQVPSGPSRSSQKADSKHASVPRTLDGHPDLQGIWTNVTLTPLERSAALAGKATLTDAEALVVEKKEEAELKAQDGASTGPLLEAAGSSGTGAYNLLFIDRGTEFARVGGVKRTSLIVDPPDGKVPALTEQARQAKGMDFERYDSVKDRPLSERCLLGFGSTSGPPMLPVLYNNNYQIVQTPDTIMIAIEMVHDVRVIRMNAARRPPSVRQWLGDSIGRWEGDTLVVDTTNFSDKGALYEEVADSRSSKNLHVIERFQRIGADTILYRATIDDPTMFTKTWMVEFPFVAAAGPIYEYACHEGNYAMPDIMGGARKQDKTPEKK